jgi:hypothetical protein
MILPNRDYELQTIKLLLDSLSDKKHMSRMRLFLLLFKLNKH